MTINHILILGTIFRISIFIILAIWPFNHLLQGNFGPLSYQNADLKDYIFTLDLLFMNNENLSIFLSGYKDILNLNFENINRTIPGPLFPLILGITNYSVETPYYLAILCFFSELICFYIWINFFNNKINIIYILGFAFLPIPLMFGFIHSTEIFFYLISTLVITRIIKYEKIDLITILLLISALMLRPASLAILLTVYIYFIFFNFEKITNKINFILIISTIISIIFYLPYFIAELNSDKVQYPYYFENIFIFQYEIVDNEIIKMIVIFLLKFFFLFGFDPSESGFVIIQVMRSFLAIIFLIGFFKTFLFKKIKLEFLYIWITIFFIAAFFYPTYRYIIPIMPFLYMIFFTKINKTL